MDWDRIAGDWKQYTGAVKEQWGNLTHDDLTQIDGRRDRLIGRLQEVYNVDEAFAEREVSTWEMSLHDSH